MIEQGLHMTCAMFHTIYSHHSPSLDVLSSAASVHSRPISNLISRLPGAGSSTPHAASLSSMYDTQALGSSRLSPSSSPCRSPSWPHLPISRQARQMGTACCRTKAAVLVGHAVAGIRGNGCTEGGLLCILRSGVRENHRTQNCNLEGRMKLLATRCSVHGERDLTARWFWCGSTGLWSLVEGALQPSTASSRSQVAQSQIYRSALLFNMTTMVLWLWCERSCCWVLKLCERWIPLQCTRSLLGSEDEALGLVVRVSGVIFIFQYLQR